MANFIIVDVEASGPCPGKGSMTEIGAILFDCPPFRNQFYGHLEEICPGRYQESQVAGLKPGGEEPLAVMIDFQVWISEVVIAGRPIFVSDNPAFDWQWVNYYFWHFVGFNPFGYSARRIGDIWAGVVGDLRKPWKQLRDTPHTHNPVDDARGNAEALWKILEMTKTKNLKQGFTGLL